MDNLKIHLESRHIVVKLFLASNLQFLNTIISKSKKKCKLNDNNHAIKYGDYNLKIVVRIHLNYVLFITNQ